MYVWICAVHIQKISDTLRTPVLAGAHNKLQIIKNQMAAKFPIDNHYAADVWEFMSVRHEPQEALIKLTQFKQSARR